MDLTQDKLRKFIESSKRPDGRPYKLLEAQKYPRTVAGLDAFLKACGIVHFSGREVATPHHQATALKQGWPEGHLIPPHSCWAHGVACLIIADQVRELIGQPLKCANWWRPDPYNNAVAQSSSNSDHPHATAIDIEFLGDSKTAAAAHAKATEYLRDLYKRTDYLALGIYPGGRRIHIGVYTAAGRRTW